MSQYGPTFDIPYRGKNVEKKFSHFSPTNFSNSSLFPDQFLKLKGLSYVGLILFQRSYSLSLGIFKLSAEECTVGVTKPILLLAFEVV